MSFSTNIPVTLGTISPGISNQPIHPTILKYMNTPTPTFSTQLKNNVTDIGFCATTPITNLGPKNTVKCLNERIDSRLTDRIKADAAVYNTLGVVDRHIINATTIDPSMILNK